jgi:hypothetical protein
MVVKQDPIPLFCNCFWATVFCRIQGNCFLLVSVMAVPANLLLVCFCECARACVCGRGAWPSSVNATTSRML